MDLLSQAGFCSLPFDVSSPISTRLIALTCFVAYILVCIETVIKRNRHLSEIRDEAFARFWNLISGTFQFAFSEAAASSEPGVTNNAPPSGLYSLTWGQVHPHQVNLSSVPVRLSLPSSRLLPVQSWKLVPAAEPRFDISQPRPKQRKSTELSHAYHCTHNYSQMHGSKDWARSTKS